MISRALVIILAFVAAGMRLQQAAWIEAAGLAALGGGLLILRVTARGSPWRRAAIPLFVVTALSMIASFVRLRSLGG